MARRRGRPMTKAITSAMSSAVTSIWLSSWPTPSREFYVDWEHGARGVVSALRLIAGHDPADRALMALVGELATHRPEFRTWWAGHTVVLHAPLSRDQTTRTLVACGPLLPCSISNSTRCPSSRLR